MTEPDFDIEFDFFDEPETKTVEAVERGSGRGPGRGPRRPSRPPAGLTPLLRLIGLVAFAILIVVLLVFWAQSCSESDKKQSYERYMKNVTTVADESERIGRELNDVLTTPGIKAGELARRLDGLTQRQVQEVVRARQLDPPGPLRPEQEHVVQALELRASGLQRLADAVRQTVGAKDLNKAAALLAEQAQRLVAADVVWTDLFQEPSRAELSNQGITGVAPPPSKFVRNADLGSARAWVPLLERLRGASTNGVPSGLHGTGLVSTKALPDGQELSATTDNTVVASERLGFAVTVEDTGDAQEVQVKVTLTIQQAPAPIVKTQTIDLINPKEQKTVVFENLGQVQFATKTTVRVDVKAVPGEQNLANNSAEYPVIFSLG